ncbi:MAG: hypothetical protein LBQ12_10335 [Deltaproteobacteria bacterium]|nr:hypothetical protein [Deltaproteobacteria bacterium]
MDLFENPFYLLGISTRSTREEIMDAAEGASLSGEPDKVAEAASALSSPRKRLSAEIFFLPGLDKAGAQRLLAAYRKPVTRVEPCERVYALTAVNLTAAALLRLQGSGWAMTAYAVGLLSKAFESADANSSMAAVNADRRLAGLPAVPSVSDVEEELDKLRLYCREVVKGALDRLPSRDLVEAAAQIVRSETDFGRRPPPVLVRDLMEIYDLESRAFFDREEATAKALCGALKAAAADRGQPRKAMAVADDLEKVLFNWQSVAAPLLTFLKSTGVTHKPSFSVARDVRDAAVDIHNAGWDPALAKKVTSILARAFADVAEVSEIAAEDAKRLAGGR